MQLNSSTVWSCRSQETPQPSNVSPRLPAVRSNQRCLCSSRPVSPCPCCPATPLAPRDTFPMPRQGQAGDFPGLPVLVPLCSDSPFRPFPSPCLSPEAPERSRPPFHMPRSGLSQAPGVIAHIPPSQSPWAQTVGPGERARQPPGVPSASLSPSETHQVALSTVLPAAPTTPPQTASACQRLSQKPPVPAPLLVGCPEKQARRMYTRAHISICVKLFVIVEAERSKS